MPPLHLLSETLQAAAASRTSSRAFSITESPGFEGGVSTEMLPSALMRVYMNRFTGVIPGLCSPRLVLMLSRQFGCPAPLW